MPRIRNFGFEKKGLFSRIREKISTMDDSVIQPLLLQKDAGDLMLDEENNLTTAGQINAKKFGVGFQNKSVDLDGKISVSHGPTAKTLSILNNFQNKTTGLNAKPHVTGYTQGPTPKSSYSSKDESKFRD